MISYKAVIDGDKKKIPVGAELFGEGLVGRATISTFGKSYVKDRYISDMEQRQVWMDAAEGKFADHAGEAAIAEFPSIVVKAVEPMPMPAVLRKERRFCKSG